MEGKRCRICLNCGDNRAEKDSVTCKECRRAMFVGQTGASHL